jgi:hypothetical protein
MRKLLYVPIIHSEPDLGSLGPAVNRRSASLSGEQRWAEHKETVSRFWQSVADYLLSLDCTSLKIYQDGLAVDGELGTRVIAEAARRGSKNHQVVLDLIKKGAEITKTEDTSLLIQEYESISMLARGEISETISSHSRSREHRDRLTKERDRFIAKTVNETLRDGETAVLFLGAYHSVLSHLASDIVVEQVKDVEKMKAYFRELFYGHSETRLRQLAYYLATQVPASRS